MKIKPKIKTRHYRQSQRRLGGISANQLPSALNYQLPPSSQISVPHTQSAAVSFSLPGNQHHVPTADVSQLLGFPIQKIYSDLRQTVLITGIVLMILGLLVGKG